MMLLLLKQGDDTDAISSRRIFLWVGHKAASSNLV